jgi:magnesium transporter
MAEDIDVAQPAGAVVLDPLPMRDEDGEIRHEFVADIARDP